MKAISRSAWFALVAAGAVYVASFSLVAQSPPVGAQGAMPPAAASPQAATPPSADPDAGRGRQGGRGGRGGPNETDPANAEADFTRQTPVLPLSPAEQAKHFVLQPDTGLSSSCPTRSSTSRRRSRSTATAACSCSRTAATCRTPTPTGERDPVGRISVHEDVNNDGVYEKHAVFVDKLVFPRFVHAVRREQHPDDGDRRRRRVEVHRHERRRRRRQEGALRDRASARSGNVEHQQSFLTWAMDNWLYSTVNAFRARWTPNGVLREPTGSNGAQWGVTQDNDGKIWFQGGASGLPSLLPVPGSSTATSTCPISSRRTSRFRGARRSASPTCRAACRPCGCRTARSTG